MVFSVSLRVHVRAEGPTRQLHGKAAGGADIEGARSERGRTCTAHLAAG